MADAPAPELNPDAAPVVDWNEWTEVPDDADEQAVASTAWEAAAPPPPPADADRPSTPPPTPPVKGSAREYVAARSPAKVLQPRPVDWQEWDAEGEDTEVAAAMASASLSAPTTAEGRDDMTPPPQEPAPGSAKAYAQARSPARK